MTFRFRQFSLSTFIHMTLTFFLLLGKAFLLNEIIQQASLSLFLSASVLVIFLSVPFDISVSCLVPFLSLSNFLSLVTLLFSISLLSMSLRQTAQGGGHRTLLYGHAVLLRHSYSGMVSERACMHTHTHTHTHTRARTHTHTHSFIAS